MAHKDYFNESNQSLASFGQFGIRVLTTDATAGEAFVAIQALENSVISSDLEAYNTATSELVGDESFASLSLSKGMIIYGRFINLQVASGKVIAYKG